MQSFLVSHAIYAIVLFGVLEAMCIPISSELTFLLGGAIASGAVGAPAPVAGAGDHPGHRWPRWSALTSPTASAGGAVTRWCAAGAGTC